MTAKYMYVCVKQNSRESQSWKSMNVFEKEKKDRVPFLRQSQDQRKGRKHLAVKRPQTLL